jgi:hypothetical protein
VLAFSTPIFFYTFLQLTNIATSTVIVVSFLVLALYVLLLFFQFYYYSVMTCKINLCFFLIKKIDILLNKTILTVKQDKNRDQLYKEPRGKELREKITNELFPYRTLWVCYDSKQKNAYLIPLALLVRHIMLPLIVVVLHDINYA